MEKLFDEIVSFFPEFQILLADLRNPTATFVRDFYCRVLFDLSVDVENVRKVQMAQNTEAQEIDLITELNLVTAIRTALPFLGFRLNDLVSPEARRSVRLISQTMEFMQFCEKRCSENNLRIVGFQEKKQLEVQLEETYEKLSNKINHLACELHNNKEIKQKLEENISKLENQIKTFKEDIDVKNEFATKVNENIKAKEHKLQIVNHEIKAVVEETEQLKKLIVDNPEEEQRKVEAITKDRARVLETKKEHQDKLKALNEIKEKQEKFEEMLAKKLIPIKNDLPILREFSEIKTFNEKNKTNIEVLQKKNDDLSKIIEDLEKKIKIEEKTYASKLAELESEESSLKELLGKKSNEYKSKNNEIKFVQKKYKSELEAARNRQTKLRKDYNEFVSKFNLIQSLQHKKAQEMGVEMDEKCI